MLLRHEYYTWFQAIQKLRSHMHAGNTCCLISLPYFSTLLAYNHFIFLNKFLTLRPKHILSLMDTRVFCGGTPVTDSF